MPLQAGRSLAHPLAGGAAEAGLALECRIDLRQAVVDRLLVVVELHLDDAEADVDGLEQRAVASFARAQLALGGQPRDRGAGALGHLAHEGELLVRPLPHLGVIEVKQRHQPAPLRHRHVEHGPGADRFESRSRGFGAGIEPGIGEDHRPARLQVLDVGPVVAKVQRPGEALDSGPVPVALDRDRLVRLVDRAVARAADAERMAQDLRRPEGELVRVRDIANAVAELAEREAARFDPLASGNVDGCADRTDASPVGVEHALALGGDPAHDAVLLADRAVFDVVERTPFGIDRRGEGSARRLAVVRVQAGIEVRHRHGRVGRDAEHRLDPQRPDERVGDEIDVPEPDLRGLRGEPELLLARARRRLGALALGEVLHGPDHAQRPAGLVAQHGPAIEHVGIGAVGAAEAIFIRPGFAGAVDEGVDALVDPRPVVGMDVLDPPLGAGAVTRGVGMAEGGVDGLVPDHGVGGEVPIPDGVVGRPRREPVALRGLAQGFFRATALRDVAVQQGEAVARRVDADVEPSVAAVRPDVAVLERDRHALGHCLLVEQAELARLGAGPNLPMRAAENLIAPARLEPHAFDVDLDDAEVAVEEHEPFRDRVEDAAHAPFALAQRVLGRAPRPLGRDPTGDVAASADEAGHPAGIFAHRRVGEGPRLLRVALAADHEGDVVHVDGLAGIGSRDDGNEVGADLVPDVEEVATERVGVLGDQDLGVRVVVEERALRPPCDEHGLVGREHQVEERLERLRPALHRAERRLGPRVSAQALSHLAVTGEGRNLFRDGRGERLLVHATPLRTGQAVLADTVRTARGCGRRSQRAQARTSRRRSRLCSPVDTRMQPVSTMTPFPPSPAGARSYTNTPSAHAVFARAAARIDRDARARAQSRFFFSRRSSRSRPARAHHGSVFAPPGTGSAPRRLPATQF